MMPDAVTILRHEYACRLRRQRRCYYYAADYYADISAIDVAVTLRYDDAAPCHYDMLRV